MSKPPSDPSLAAAPLDRETLIARFDGIRQFAQGGRRAPHKPLLLLYALARLKHDRQAEIRFNATKAALQPSLHVYGPWGVSAPVSYSYGRLVWDGLWQLPDRADLFDAGGNPGISRDFFGPANPGLIVALLGLGEAENEAAGSGRYGQPWRLPLSHRARATLGDRLALLGDPRPGVGLREDGLPDINWCRIKGGTVTIELNKNKRLISNVKPFSMARYPITIDQYKPFVEDCYRDGRWKLPPGFPAETRLQKPPEHRGRPGNYSADSVSWYAAVAYCHWLSVRLGAKIQLPTEFEWQLAATGGDPANIFPWGADWDPEQEPWRANTFESGLESYTAVGLYPLGAAKAKVLDMAGTIWEWCLNAHDDPSDTAWPAKDADPRVLRGGSWYVDQSRARCTFRGRYRADARDYGIGFRVVCLSC